MSVETVISLSDHLAVEPFFAPPRFTPCHEQDRLTLRIESKGHPPLTISRAEAQLLHIRVARVVQRISAGPLQLRPELLEKPSHCQNLRPHVFVQRVELRLKLIANLNNPAYIYTMIYSPYDVNSIFLSLGERLDGSPPPGLIVSG